MSVKGCNKTRGVLIPLDLYSDLFGVVAMRCHDMKRDVVNCIRFKGSKPHVLYAAKMLRDTQRLLEKMSDCKYSSFAEARISISHEERFVLTEYCYVNGSECVRSFGGTAKQCRQKMAKWYRKRKREANRYDCDVCSHMEYNHALVQDEQSGSFRYEFWIKESCN